MKKIFYILFLFSSLLSFSQFNIIVEDTANNHIYSSTVIQNDYYILHNGFTDSDGNRGFSFIKSDTSGNIIWKKEYSKQNESWYEQYNGNIIKLDTTYICAGYKLDSIGKPVIYVLNNEFDTLFTKEYLIDTIDIRTYTISKTSDNGFILAGQWTTTDSINAILIKIDSSFNYVWHKTYGTGLTDMLGNKIIETYDSSLISIGFTFVGAATYKQDWYIVKTDSLGNLDWWMHPGNPILNDGSAADIIQTRDSCFVVVGGKAVYRDAGGTKFDGHIMKFDINGTVIWDKTYRKRLTESSYDTVYCFFNSIEELDDGGFVVTANEQILMGGHQNSVLYRFNSEGDTLWTRHYCTRYEYTTIDFPDQEYPTTIQKIDNGSFLIGGWGYFGYTFDHPYTQQMFLIKTDSLGCDGTEFSCPLVVMPSLLSANESGVLVYPNPAKDNLQLVMSNVQLGKNTSVFIYDVFGRAEKLPLTKGAGGIFSINVSTLPRGIYFIKIGNLTQKFVKL